MRNKDLILGIDTSNYTTSLAITDINGSVINDSRKLLTVKQGERGLRQSHALFQHMENLPVLIEEALQQVHQSRIGAVAASEKPRPVEGSYMPVFRAGVNYGKVMAASLGVPFFEFSHQEGHLEAVKHGSRFEEETEYLAYHLSGGTSELLHVKNESIKIIGGSRDLSFGQVIDRVGVALGMEFPCGREMDSIALKTRDKQMKRKSAWYLKKVKVEGLEINLSGMETQCQREIGKSTDRDQVIYELFYLMSQCLCELSEKSVVQENCPRILFTGGVSASQFVRHELKERFADQRIEILFGNPALSSDNAVGISFLGGKKLWR